MLRMIIQIGELLGQGNIFLSGGSSNSNGVGILINKSCNCDIIEYKEIIVGRMQLIKLHISDSNVILINLYAPNNDDVNFYNSLENTIKDYGDETLIIVPSI